MQNLLKLYISSLGELLCSAFIVCGVIVGSAFMIFILFQGLHGLESLWDLFDVFLKALSIVVLAAGFGIVFGLGIGLPYLLFVATPILVFLKIREHKRYSVWLFASLFSTCSFFVLLENIREHIDLSMLWISSEYYDLIFTLPIQFLCVVVSVLIFSSVYKKKKKQWVNVVSDAFVEEA